MKFSTKILVIIVVILVGVHKGNGKESLRTDPGPTIADRRKDSSNLLDIVKAGVHRGLRECQRLFKNEVWDCSFYNKNVTRKLPDFMETTLPYANRETGFLHAITTAAILHEVVHRCKKDRIPGCRCIQMTNKTTKGGKIQWQRDGCSDNIEFGETMTRNFLNALQQGNSERATVDSHNNEVGMRVSKSIVIPKCECLTLNCTDRVCWKSLAPFHATAAQLKKKYRQAVRVTLSNNELQEQSNGQNVRIGLSLIYLDSSPDYCVQNKTAGSLGLLGRTCGYGDETASKCRSLCTKCNLKSQTEEQTKQVKCRCKFVCCRRLECKTCRRKYSVTTCTRKYSEREATQN